MERSSAEEQHKKLWQFIAKKEIPKVCCVVVWGFSVCLCVCLCHRALHGALPQAAKVVAVGRHMSLSSAKKVSV